MSSTHYGNVIMAAEGRLAGYRHIGRPLNSMPRECYVTSIVFKLESDAVGSEVTLPATEGITPCASGVSQLET
jgi:hypothetical protein